MRRVLLVLVLAACDRSHPRDTAAAPAEPAKPTEPAPQLAAPPPEDAAMTTGPAELTASLSRDGDHLALQVSVKNASAQPLYVVDQLVVSRPQNKFARTDRPIVMNDGGSVLFALAAMSADEPSTVLYPPTYRKLAPGETFARTLRLPAPLAAWHNVAGVSPLAASAKTGVFATQVIAGEPPGWRTLPSDDAQPLSVPDGATPQLVRSAPFPLP